MQTETNPSKRAEESADSSQNLISMNIDLVERLVRHFVKSLPRVTDADDLRQAGLVGLVEAAQTFDPARGIHFSKFASCRIWGAIVDELRSRYWAPRALPRQLRRIAEVTRRLEQEAGRSTTLAEIADALNTSVREIDRARSDAQCAKIKSLDAFESDDHKGLKILGAAASPAENLDDTQVRSGIVDAIDSLGARERKIISLRYGSGSSQVEVAELLNVTAGRICQLEAKAIAQLRVKLRDSSSDSPASDREPARGGVNQELCAQRLPLFAPRDGLTAEGIHAHRPHTGRARYLLQTLCKKKSRRSSSAWKRSYTEQAAGNSLRGEIALAATAPKIG